MLPEQNSLALPETRSSDEALKTSTAVFLGGDAMISPIFGSFNKIDAYEVVLTKPDGGTVTFRVSRQQGEDLIAARLSLLASEVAQDQVISDEAFQSLLPTYVAEEYKKRLLALGVPEEEIPNSVTAMVTRAKGELEKYIELGKVQIASDSQRIADELISITKEVLSGNNFRYNNLPDEFKESVEFLRPTFTALALESAGVSEKTLEAQKMALAINLMSQQKYRDVWIEHFKAGFGGAADIAGTFFGKLLGSAYGTTKGAAEAAYTKTKEVLKKK